jgi:hypothetical protein
MKPPEVEASFIISIEIKIKPRRGVKKKPLV